MKKNNDINSSPIRFIDLFAGVGGFRYAIQNACNELGMRAECVFTSEIDAECQKVYKENFGDIPQGDITKITEDSIPDHDVLLAGFPCQPFSIIGQMKGFEDTRGTLFFDIARIIKEKRPKVFVLENVKLLAGHNKGQTLKVIQKTLEELGYHTTYKVLNALNFGLPQKRERIFIVGFREPCFFKWPDKETLMMPLSSILEKHVDQKYYASERIRNKRLSRQNPTIEPTIWHENKSGNISAYPYSCALRAGASYNYLLVNGERRLTPREMFRLQGYPEEFKIISCYTQARKQAGNSLPVPMAQVVIKNTIEASSCLLLPGDKGETDKLIIDGQLRIFEKASKYGKVAQVTDSRKIQATIQTQ
ncbi:MAG: DNA (cytosine-5-)-methyltransferase [Desulfobacteraceae bacterium 4572_35.2]|nr:MAG: DNA (cytosine-5-)-methyltransferase [Desulfobacteraceae bacterium 4572_35.2]